MKPSRTVIEQRSRAYVVAWQDKAGAWQARSWSTHAMALKHAVLLSNGRMRSVTLDGKGIGR